ncbi:class I adenylate-forming enzyme family protein [Streptomyces sp. ADMS]|uniref:class I adenylate-forming enzyme family protein n=1 Tax=Streptomyces sp. ADMS TaxID=3071415 RepID=UPI002970081D|nr:class I adenylate-forming enzyme family protein [Streptomyces sp. ADMS]MDW4905798.1 class I adenylate-forming enzyme family protein [Streptomyces sp. ADMS]
MAAPPVPTLDQLFARSARRFPTRIAVQDGWHQLTYARTEQRATQLASALVLGGVQLGDALVVHCENHRQALVAQLAVLKAGGVCVPVPRSPSGPELARAVEASGARAVLSSRAAYDRRVPGVPTLALDDPATWRKIAASPVDPSLPRSGPEEAAHLMLAGDQGPAGDRLVDHRSWWLSIADRVRRAGSATHTVAVDEPPMSAVALAAMWWAFTDGGTLHSAPWSDDANWPLAGGGSGITMMTPAGYARHLERPAHARPATGSSTDPGTVVLLGDPCSRSLVTRHFAVRPATRLWAEFAPVGGPVPWTAHQLFARDARQPHALGAGRSVPPARIRILGPRGHNLPRGEAGELVAVVPAGVTEDVQRSGWYGCWTSERTLEVTERPTATARGALRPPAIRPPAIRPANSPEGERT